MDFHSSIWELAYFRHKTFLTTGFTLSLFSASSLVHPEQAIRIALGTTYLQDKIRINNKEQHTLYHRVALSQATPTHTHTSVTG